MIGEADRIAADFSTIPFPGHEARTLALAYFRLKAERDALADALRELLDGMGVEHDDARLGYITVQLDRVTLNLVGSLAALYPNRDTRP